MEVKTIRAVLSAVAQRLERGVEELAAGLQRADTVQLELALAELAAASRGLTNFLSRLWDAPPAFGLKAPPPPLAGPLPELLAGSASSPAAGGTAPAGAGPPTPTAAPSETPPATAAWAQMLAARRADRD